MAAHDPFQLLTVLVPKIKQQPSTSVKQTDVIPKVDKSQQQREKIAMVRESLKSRVVRGIFISGGKKEVLIDAKLYHEGDLLEKGIRVHQINAYDIVLEIESLGRISLQ